MRDGRPLARLVAALGQADAEGERGRRDRTRDPRAELLHAAHHQPRGDQQHEREGDLCGHQQLARAMLTARRGLPAAAVVQGRGDRREAQQRDRAERDGREQAQPGGEDDDDRNRFGLR